MTLPTDEAKCHDMNVDIETKQKTALSSCNKEPGDMTKSPFPMTDKNQLESQQAGEIWICQKLN